MGVLEEEIKREYVSKVIEYYGSTLEEKDKERWRKRDGLEILSYIQKYLNPEETSKSEEVFGKLVGTNKITPHPSVGKITSGTVNHKAPFDPAEKTIDELVELLKTDANPKSLNEKFKGDEFFNRRGPEGLSDAIKNDFKNRKSEYLSDLDKFFDRESIDACYVYAIIRQIEETLRAKESFNDSEYIQILDFFTLIKDSGEKDKFIPSEEKTYLADWITVHKVMADVLLEMLATIKDSEVFKDNRSIKILPLIKYLLSIRTSPDPDDEKHESDEPAHVAVNSVRGQAFRAFVQFMYNDGNETLSDDIKEIYESILDTDNSNAVRFTIGQFLASFYFRDIDFVKNLLPKIFPKDEEGKENLYFATWEGYLSSSLYKELFEELKEYYEFAIKLDASKYPDRKYSKGLDESLGVHLALAYTHFEFDTDDALFNLFWDTSNDTRHYEFVSFIGRTCITRSEAGDEWFNENGVTKDKLINFWDWIIETDKKIGPKAFSGFGFWINPDKEILNADSVVKNLAITLKKSEGEIDWDYGLTQRIKTFAEIDPSNTLKIISEFLTLEGELNTNRRVPIFHIDKEIKDALKIIYKEDELKEKVVKLIDLLITKGSSTFWVLKDVIE